MQLSHQGQSHFNGRGFTLFELLIVLAVVVMITAMAAPPLMERVRNGRVQEASDDLRELVTEARRMAIDSGVDYHFRYEIDGNAAIAIPAEPDPALANSVDGDPSSTSVLLQALILDETMAIRPMKGDSVIAEKLESKYFSTLENAGDLSQRTWSGPVLFRFDGSAEDARFRVMDEENRASEISIRGLTGAVRTTPVFIMEDN